LTLTVVLLSVTAALMVTSVATSVLATTLLFMMCFALLGCGNGALFQLVPLRWPANAAVAGSMIGEIGALGGAFVPLSMGYSKQHTGSYALGFIMFAALALVVLVALRIIQRTWIGKWVGPGGRALTAPPAPDAPMAGIPDLA
jgi:NNP family nitrate/nitrite transporter-like MFS transporter